MKKEVYTDHISKQFNAELDTVRSKLLEMGGLVEKQVADAIDSLINVDVKKAEQVQNEESEIDKMDIALDEECTRILALRQPAASDLRLVLAISKMVADLERMGNEAKKIARQTDRMDDGIHTQPGFVEVRHVGAHVLRMVNDCLDSFARLDVPQAIAVVKEDKKVDLEYETALRDVISEMIEDPRNIGRMINVIWALRALERIGDYARSIAAHVVYLVEGQTVRHLSANKIVKKINKS